MLIVPANNDSINERIDIAPNRSWYKILASIFQVRYSYYTVDQDSSVKRWGYASIFFSPSFYTVMSVVNLCGNLLTSDYPKIYMVHSETMDEAIEVGGAFDGVLGRVIQFLVRLMTLDIRLDLLLPGKEFPPIQSKESVESLSRQQSGG